MSPPETWSPRGGVYANYWNKFLEIKTIKIKIFDEKKKKKKTQKIMEKNETIQKNKKKGSIMNDDDSLTKNEEKNIYL